ncbi:MAG: SAM-dependent chlorinase/fluorinase [Chloroflexota bacterium]|nr:SAM-dependent chlorinase/fluorinase [Chloroflexota bacterium]
MTGDDNERTGWHITRAQEGEGSEELDMDAPAETPTPSRSSRLITFLTDFGLAWGPVGICHAVMHDITPDARITDISHGIPPFDVRAGAWVLASALPYTPVSVHLAVVDPGVGTDRLPLALLCERGDVLVGPDNGLLVPAAERLGGLVEARRIANEDLMRHPVSSTFHGRDVFAPTAANLAAGVPFEEVGPAVDRSVLVPAPWRRPEYEDRRARGEAVLLDNFGNIRTNLETRKWPLQPGSRVRVRTSAGSAELGVARTFGEVGRGELFVYEDSSDYICVAMNLGSAGNALGVRPGDTLELDRQ